MRYELKSIGIWSFTKVAFFFNLVAGFIFGLLYALFLGVFLTLATQVLELPIDEGELGEISLVFLVLFIPIISAIGGAVFCTLFGIVLLIIYNLIARALGGLEFELKRVDGLPDTVSAQPIVGQASLQQPAQMRPVAPPPPPPPAGPVPPPPPGPTGPDDRRSTDTE